MLSDTHVSEPHSSIICGQTGCGKTQFVLDELLQPERVARAILDYRDYIRLMHLVRILKRLIVQTDCNEFLEQLMKEERPADTASPRIAPIAIETVSARDINH